MLRVTEEFLRPRGRRPRDGFLAHRACDERFCVLPGHEVAPSVDPPELGPPGFRCGLPEGPVASGKRFRRLPDADAAARQPPCGVRLGDTRETSLGNPPSLGCDGHCGHIADGGTIDNDSSIATLAEVALNYARAGADAVAPSDMMDGRVQAIRALLDREGRASTPIVSYAAKYASAFYGPFREAAESAPAFGDALVSKLNERVQR